jgi:hypothetical protein
MRETYESYECGMWSLSSKAGAIYATALKNYVQDNDHLHHCKGTGLLGSQKVFTNDGKHHNYLTGNRLSAVQSLVSDDHI